MQPYRTGPYKELAGTYVALLEHCRQIQAGKIVSDADIPDAAFLSDIHAAAAEAAAKAVALSKAEKRVALSKRTKAGYAADKKRSAHRTWHGPSKHR